MNTENNILIAKFMNPKLHMESQAVIQNLFKYHSDWNWLMEVGKQCLVLIENEMWHEWEESLSEAIGTFDNTIAYNRIVQFIKWYNEQKKV